MTHAKNRIRGSFTARLALTAMVAMFYAVSVHCQTSGPQTSTQSQTASDDWINPDRPGIADGSTVVGPETFQIESGIQLEFRRSRNSSEHTLFIPTLLRFGIAKRWEARIEGNTFTRESTFESGALTDQSSGFAPTSIGFKYQFYNSSAITLGTIVRVFPPWGSRDFRTQHVTGDVRVAADWNFAKRAKLSLNPNIGLARYEDDQGRLFTAGLFAVTLNYLPTKKLNPFVDVGAQSPEVIEGQSAAVFDGGLAFTIERNLEVDASAGTRIHGVTGPRPFVAFGVSWRSRISHRHQESIAQFPTRSFPRSTVNE
ncbi:MAG: hypothetical protein C5B55_06270 [Blastocatellia bacterium]|nr:MAG: hypothetical protein C5B55_06270 [Blastocatellia bacterium]